MTLLQEGNFKEIFKTDEGNFVQNEEKLWAKQEILGCKSGNPDGAHDECWRITNESPYAFLTEHFSLYSIYSLTKHRA